MSERIFLLSQYPEIALILWDFNTDEIEESVLFFTFAKELNTSIKVCSVMRKSDSLTNFLKSIMKVFLSLSSGNNNLSEQTALFRKYN